MRWGLVVVSEVLTQHPLEMAASEDDERVEALSANATSDQQRLPGVHLGGGATVTVSVDVLSAGVGSLGVTMAVLVIVVPALAVMLTDTTRGRANPKRNGPV